MEDITNYFKDKYVAKIDKFTKWVCVIGNFVLSFIVYMLFVGLYSVLGLPVGLLAYFVPISFFFATSISLFSDEKKKVQGITRDISIYSLESDKRTKSSLTGSFILGCGSVNGSSEEVDYYVFYKTGRFGLIKDKIEAYDVEVIQRDDIEPSYKTVLVEGEEFECLFVPTNTIKKKIVLGDD